MKIDFDLIQKQLNWLAPISVLTSRLIFDFEDSRSIPEDATLSTVRGAWGNALHKLDTILYHEIFEGIGGTAARLPLYLCRPDIDSAGVPFRNRPGRQSVQWVTLNVRESEIPMLLQAWQLAGNWGLGHERKRFTLTQTLLSNSLFDLAISTPDTPCHLVFMHSLRLIRDGKLNFSPTPKDFVIAALNRLSTLRAAALAPNRSTLQFSPSAKSLWPAFAQELLDLAVQIPHEPWVGTEQNLIRYSGRQKRVVQLDGAAGRISFPAGLSALAPLFSAAVSVHLGKGTVLGLGRPFVLPIRNESEF